MKKIECPSCAMIIEKDSNTCPVCGYEFPSTNQPLKWVTVLLILLLLFYFLFL